MRAWRWRLGPLAASPAIGLGAPEGLLYLAAGSGTAEASGRRFALAPESVLWLPGCPQVVLRQAGPGSTRCSPWYRGKPGRPRRPGCSARLTCRIWCPPGTAGTGWT